jgi:hypothetical protein
MMRAIGIFAAKLNLKRFPAHVDIAGLVEQDRIFSSFSIICCSGICILVAAVWFVALTSAGIVVPLLVKWVELFKLREIFRITLFDSVLIANLYHVFVAVILTLVSVKGLLQVMKYAFSVLLLCPERIIIVESNLFRSSIHQIPYDKIFRVSARETIVHRVLRLGTLEILTGERDTPLRFGPAPRFSHLISRLMDAGVKK